MYLTTIIIMADILSWLGTSINQAVMPNLTIIAQVIVLLIAAYVVGRVVKIFVIKLLNVMGLKKVTSKTWAEGILKAAGYKGTIIGLIGDLVKWLIYILFLAIIIQTLGLPGLAEIFTQIAIFIPRFIGAVLLMVIGFLIADFFGKMFEEAGRRYLQDDVLPGLSGGLIKYSISLIGIVMALAMLGLDTSTLIIMFTLVLGTIIVLLLIGIKDTFPNMTAGIQIKKEFRPGEYIKVGQYSGVIERIDRFSVSLRDRDKRVTIPTSMLIKLPVERKVK